MAKIVPAKSEEEKDKKVPAKFELGMLEEDDEFEEFVAHDVTNKPKETDDVTVWEDNWDDDIVDDEFMHQLSPDWELFSQLNLYCMPLMVATESLATPEQHAHSIVHGSNISTSSPETRHSLSNADKLVYTLEESERKSHGEYYGVTIADTNFNDMCREQLKVDMDSLTIELDEISLMDTSSSASSESTTEHVSDNENQQPTLNFKYFSASDDEEEKIDSPKSHDSSNKGKPNGLVSNRTTRSRKVLHSLNKL